MSDREIREKRLGVDGVMPPRGSLISPFEPEQVRRVKPNHLREVVKAISFGVSSYGYDFRLSATNFQVFRNPGHIIVDPKNFDQAITENGGDYTGPERLLLHHPRQLLRTRRDGRVGKHAG